MRQLVQIKKIVDNTHAEIFLERPSACGGNCHDCGGCGGDQKRVVIATAVNEIGARVGDQVYVEADTGKILLVIALVYLVPLALFLIGYAVGSVIQVLPALLGGIGFVLGVLGAIAFNRRVEKEKYVHYRIVSFA
jgi:sigma-E factor negative regulatory protein RseC